MYDFNTAAEQRDFDLIPADTIVTVRLKIRPGNAGESGWLKRSKDGQSEALDCEFVALDGEYAKRKRKFWSLLMVAGVTDGHKEAANISSQKIRAMLESAHGVRPDDISDAAKAARQITSWGDLDGLCFVCRVGIEPAQNGYKAKNKLDYVITPDRQDWHAVTQEPAPAAAPTAASSTTAKPASAPAKIERPPWAG
jgi:hypothetical protein